MALLINKDGKQLGPYSLDEARAQVLAGRLSPTDWAWADGANDWVLLKDIPGFSLTVPPTSPPTALQAGAAMPAAEEELWSGHPSQMLNLSIYVFWGFVLVLTLAALVVANVFTDSAFWGCTIVGVVSLVALVNAAIAYIHLHAIEYVVTNQRVQVISGIFNKDIQEIELFRVKDTQAKQSFLLRLFGLGTITILSGDASHPRIVLSGVPRAIELREQLRTEVMTLRQRFGVREMDVM